MTQQEAARLEAALLSACAEGEPDMGPTPLDRFFDKVDGGDCWLWTGALDRGYGKFFPAGKTVRAHRWLFEQLVGPVPDGMDLDHLCRVRACVNPDHLQPVSRRVNLNRGAGTSHRRSRSQQLVG